MKLSTLRWLSWSLALTGAGAAAFFTDPVVKKALLTKPKAIEVVAYIPPSSIENIKDIRDLSDKQVLEALHNIIHIPPPPPPPPSPPPSPPPENTAPVVVEPVLPPVETPRLKLRFIAFDDSPRKSHLVFIEDELNKHTRPYMEGDSLASGLYTLILIERHRVMLKDSLDRPIDLFLEGGTPSSGPADEPPSGMIQILSSKPKDIPPPPVPEKLNERDKLNLYVDRTLPFNRAVEFDPSYGITVIEYDKGKSDTVRRFAINENDIARLEANQFRMLSEFHAEEVSDDKGQPMGVRLNFLADDTILNKYGFKSDDIITHINDQPLRSQDQARELYDQLSPETRRVKIHVKRNDQPFIVFLEMDDFPEIKPPAAQ